MSLRDVTWRRFAVSLILAPYFVNIKCISEKESFTRIKEWALGCNEVKTLHPSVRFFEDLINKSIQRARLNSEIRPMRFEGTLKFKGGKLSKIEQLFYIRD
jgi:hypothetical protein